MQPFVLQPACSTNTDRLWTVSSCRLCFRRRCCEKAETKRGVDLCVCVCVCVFLLLLSRSGNDVTVFGEICVPFSRTERSDHQDGSGRIKVYPLFFLVYRLYALYVLLYALYSLYRLDCFLLLDRHEFVRPRRRWCNISIVPSGTVGTTTTAATTITKTGKQAPNAVFPNDDNDGQQSW